MIRPTGLYFLLVVGAKFAQVVDKKWIHNLEVIVSFMLKVA
jgi:hypothetical protein